ncbi:MAG: STAS domain-containing protein [Scytolyngbya sp. HA4215-MV1]|jgi:anti-anti-sigma factor|nr:STAS domain-containing protein [Scytolyngbya sp. HA4215-MV1]
MLLYSKEALDLTFTDQGGVEPERIKAPTIKTFSPSRILSSVTTGDLLEGILTSLDAGAEIIVVNLQDVSFMDSTGLGALILAHKKVRKAGKRLVLCSVWGQTRMLLEHSGMANVFETYFDQEEFNRLVLNR